MTNAANPSGGLKPFRWASMRGLMDSRCPGEHDIFVCENLYVQAEGKIVTVAVCRHCAQFYYSEKQIAKANHEAEFLKGNERK